MRLLYSLLFYLGIPYILFRLWRRSLRAPAYRHRIKERFGFGYKAAEKGGVWIHAVSVGEVVAAIPLVKKLRRDYPKLAITMTTMTPTGSHRVRSQLGDEVYHCYVPYDLPFAVRRFLKHVRPRLAMFMETELWPNIFHYCRQNNIPTFVANGRMSNRSAEGYQRFPKFTAQIVSNITKLAAQTRSDASRFIDLGVKPKSITVTGSMKFDFQIPASVYEQGEALRQTLGMDRPVFVAGSTHEGEEELVLQGFALIREKFPQTLLILCPRHPERFAKVAALCRRKDYKLALRSSGDYQGDTDVFLGDTMGELLLFYAASDVAFVGGSMVPIGGHNLLEPCGLGIPAITGPHVFNFMEINRLLQKVGAVTQVNNPAQLAHGVCQLLGNSDLRNSAGEKGHQVIANNRGAVKAHMKILQGMLN